MRKTLGLNVNPLQVSAPDFISSGARAARINLVSDTADPQGTLGFYTDYAHQLLEAHIEPFYVLARESWEGWDQGLTPDWRKLPGIWFQMGNEPNGKGPSSYKQTRDEFTADLAWAKWWFGPNINLVAGGLEGNALWLTDEMLAQVGWAAVHAYQQAPNESWTWGDGFLASLCHSFGAALQGKNEQGLIVSEFGVEFQAPFNRVDFLRDSWETIKQYAEMAFIYCGWPQMNPPFGLSRHERDQLRELFR